MDICLLHIVYELHFSNIIKLSDIFPESCHVCDDSSTDLYLLGLTLLSNLLFEDLLLLFC